MDRGSRMRSLGAVTAVAALTLGVGVAQAGGGTVNWKWVNGRHTVTFVKGSFDKSLNKSHRTRSRTFNTAGTFKYFCRFHRSLGMTGKVVVQ